jgi:hypothetical protein
MLLAHYYYFCSMHVNVAMSPTSIYIYMIIAIAADRLRSLLLYELL